MRRFTPEEEKVIVADCIDNKLSAQDLATKYNSSNTAIYNIAKRYNLSFERKPQSDHHAKKTKENIVKAQQACRKQFEENAPTRAAEVAELTQKIIDLRKQGLKQAEIGNVVGMSQCAVSAYIIRSGIKGLPKRIVKK